MAYKVRILETEMLNHNVKRFVTEKPVGLVYTPGQATLVEIKEMPGDKHPFTFTRLPEDPNLEFTIKLYTDHQGITAKLREYKQNDILQIGDPWGAIEYKGPGLFLAGGAGVTPFLSILRMLKRDGKIAGNALWFSNRTQEDIFLRDEFREILGDQVRFLITDGPPGPYEKTRIDKDYLLKHVKNFDQYFYVCGPEKMVKELSSTLEELGASKNKIVMEDL